MFSYGSFLRNAFLFKNESVQNCVFLSTEEFVKVFGNKPPRFGQAGFFDIASFMASAGNRKRIDLVSLPITDDSVPLDQMVHQGLYVYFQGDFYYFSKGKSSIFYYSRLNSIFVNFIDENSDDYDKLERKLVEAIGFERFSLTHYNYLDIVFKEFSEELLGEDLSGFIAAHGDKSSQYKTYWEQHGVPFFHGAAIHLLSYTKLMDREKRLTKEFVVDKYPEFKPLLDKLDEKYKLTKAIR